ncbi:hypothetical protein GGI59_004015 [Rhizobium lentis]|uniref:Uncharacterized protein n=1 Tax=Rhizobium lentis TaxID=1138194 RepID=A0A7W8XGC0_9HYPH|nr:hypothetical protein [Rhizobium lentis]MBB5551793.1 hypothetical protein [Rhizobium lentis]MBB5562331.1 hypothetical protein [Rhizobium lentis]MBB5568958.1 hypothetical protein [Rhizobium lentis]
MFPAADVWEAVGYALGNELSRPVKPNRDTEIGIF